MTPSTMPGSLPLVLECLLSGADLIAVAATRGVPGLHHRVGLVRLHRARLVGLVHVGRAALRRVAVARSLLVTTRRRRLRECDGGDENAREGQSQCVLPTLHAMPSSGALKSIRLGPPPHLPPRPGPRLSRPG